MNKVVPADAPELREALQELVSALTLHEANQRNAASVAELRHTAKRYTAALKNARAALQAAALPQEPVAWRLRHPRHQLFWRMTDTPCSREDLANGWEQEALYAAPPIKAPQEPASMIDAPMSDYKALCDIWQECNALGTVLGDQERLQSKIAKLRDGIGARPLAAPSLKAPQERYWQHSETGRICVLDHSPGPRWHEIAEPPKAAPAAPSGYVLVPIEPTEEMLSAAEATEGITTVNDIIALHCARYNHGTALWAPGNPPLQQAWRAMLNVGGREALADPLDAQRYRSLLKFMDTKPYKTATSDERDMMLAGWQMSYDAAMVHPTERFGEAVQRPSSETER